MIAVVHCWNHALVTPDAEDDSAERESGQDSDRSADPGHGQRLQLDGSADLAWCRRYGSQQSDFAVTLLHDQGKHSCDHHGCDDDCDAAKRACDRDERQRRVAVGDELGTTAGVTCQHRDVIVEGCAKIVRDRIDVRTWPQRHCDEIYLPWVGIHRRQCGVGEEQRRLVLECSCTVPDGGRHGSIDDCPGGGDGNGVTDANACVTGQFGVDRDFVLRHWRAPLVDFECRALGRIPSVTPRGPSGGRRHGRAIRIQEMRREGDFRNSGLDSGCGGDLCDECSIDSAAFGCFGCDGLTVLAGAGRG